MDTGTPSAFRFPTSSTVTRFTAGNSTVDIPRLVDFAVVAAAAAAARAAHAAAVAAHGVTAGGIATGVMAAAALVMAAAAVSPTRRSRADDAPCIVVAWNAGSTGTVRCKRRQCRLQQEQHK